MGKPIQQKPPYFKECPICHREFGSKSLEIHKSRCLERQKSSSDQVRNGFFQIKTFLSLINPIVYQNK